MSKWTSKNQHSRFKHEDWQYVVDNEGMQLSYHDWVVAQQDEWTSDVRALNDRLRRGQAAGRISFIGSIVNCEAAEIVKIVQQVQKYEAFSEGNDPHGEHDFGSFDIEDQKYMWKIDYYDQSMENLSPNPADPAVTVRVLTIFFAEDY